LVFPLQPLVLDEQGGVGFRPPPPTLGPQSSQRPLVALFSPGRQALLAGCWKGAREHISRSRRGVRENRRPGYPESLGGESAEALGRLNYPQRLAAGRAIGSGQVEGTCKHMIGRRLKHTGARWQVSRVNRMTSVCAMLYSHNWGTYWATPIAIICYRTQPLDFLSKRTQTR